MTTAFLQPEKHVATAGHRRRLRRGAITPRTVVNILVILVLAYLVAGPLIMLGISVFEDTSFGVVVLPPFPWTFDNVRTVFTDSHTYTVIWTTALFAGGALIFSMAVSLTFAWLVERTDLPARNTVFVLLVAPQGIPAVIQGIAWSLLMNPTNGVLNVALRKVVGDTSHGPLNVYTLPWMILVQGMALVPLTFLLVTASLRGMNASLEEAARASGARFGTILRRITLPLLKPAIIGALIYEFVNVVETADIPLLLGTQGHIRVLSTQIYYATHPATGLPNYGVSSTYGALLLFIALIPIVFYNRIVGDSGRYATVTGKTFRPRQQKLGRWKPVAMLLTWGYIFVAFMLPLAMLVWASIQPYLGDLSTAALHRITLKTYHSTLSSHLFLTALKNTVVVGLSAAAMAMILSLLVSWIIARSRSRFRWIIDALAFLPHAIPGVVIGLSVLLIYLLLPIGVYGTIWIIVIGLGTQYVSLGTRVSTGGITQIQRTLEEAAEASGASAWHVWRRVLLPLLRPVFFNGFLMVFLASIQNLTLPLMLYSTGNLVMSTLIFTRWTYGDATGTAVISVIMTIITIAAALLLRRASGDRASG